MPKSYTLNEKSRRTGPFTEQQLEQRYSAGEIDGDTLCWPVEFLGIFAGTWKPLCTFFPHFRSPSLEQQDREWERETYQADAIIFSCLDCGTQIRIRVLNQDAVYRCPSCKADYKTIRASGETPVFLVLPVLRDRAKASDSSRRRKRSISPEIRNALAIFGLSEDATLTEVRGAYREQVKQYHPDKVAHLGEALRNLAEMKTKEFNSAYQALGRFYS